MRVRLTAALVALLALGAALSPADAATTTWKRTPVFVGASGDQVLGDLSCPSTTVCIAVGGERVGKTGPVTSVAARWSPTTGWVRERLPKLPAGMTVESVACPPTGACVATAEGLLTGVVSRTAALVRRPGGAWSVVATPNPSKVGKGTQLSDVACTSATFCMAVGSKDSGKGLSPHAIRWNGSGWALLPTPAASASTFKGYESVSCVSASACTAVGSQPASAYGLAALVHRWDGRTWAAASEPGSPTSTLTQLFQVSCATASRCMLLGTTTSHVNAVWTSDPSALNGWTEIAPPAGIDPTDIACSSPSACFLTGLTSASGVRASTVARYDGAAWHREALPTLAPRNDGPNGLTCVRGTGFCGAVGSSSTVSGPDRFASFFRR